MFSEVARLVRNQQRHRRVGERRHRDIEAFLFRLDRLRANIDPKRAKNRDTPDDYPKRKSYSHDRFNSLLLTAYALLDFPGKQLRGVLAVDLLNQ